MGSMRPPPLRPLPLRPPATVAPRSCSPTPVLPGSNECPAGGTRFSVGKDADGNGTLNDGEATITYACNGVAAQVMGWVNVTQPVEPFLQALANTGYVAESEQQVTIKLPAAPARNGLVRISGLGSGGWKVVQNEGQSIMVDNLPLPWKKHQSGRWASVASSGNGEILLAVEDLQEQYEQIHVSTRCRPQLERQAGDPGRFAEAAERAGHVLLVH